MEKYLIAGGAGFIGANLCERLISDGHFVVCIDDLTTGSKSNIEHLVGNPNFIFIPMSIVWNTDSDIFLDLYSVLYSHFKNDGCIINLASPASPVAYKGNPLGTLNVNLEGTKNLLEIAQHLSLRFIQVSTIKVLENSNPLSTDACYVEGKRAAETLCMEYRKKNMDVRIARLYNTYGKYMSIDDGRVVPTFITNALYRMPPHIIGGDQLDSFCYIDDIVDGLLKLAAYSGDEYVFTFGYPDMLSIKALWKIVIDNTGGYKPYVVSETTTYSDRPRPDITLAQNLLQWVPKTDIETGIKKTIEYFRKIV
jgi:UDP-glucuronate decarboxylase